MELSKKVFTIILLIQAMMAVASAASTSDWDNYSDMKLPDAPKPFQSQRLSLVLPSFVVHGFQPDQASTTAMPRKIDGNGDMVVTPGVGLQYIGETGVFVLAAGVKDCYDNLAGTLQIGKMWETSDRTTWGLSMGVYARQTPMQCTVSQSGMFVTTTCTDLDGYPWKFNATVNNQPVDIIPMPFFHFTTAIYKDRDFRIDFKVMGNVVLNEVGIAVPF